jgi:hypothetical protein
MHYRDFWHINLSRLQKKNQHLIIFGFLRQTCQNNQSKSLDQNFFHCPIFLTAIQKNLAFVSELMRHKFREKLLEIIDLANFGLPYCLIP